MIASSFSFDLFLVFCWVIRDFAEYTLILREAYPYVNGYRRVMRYKVIIGVFRAR